jgi:hypothetical protein
VAASIDRAENSNFLEKFRYTIVASQLLSSQSLTWPQRSAQGPSGATAGRDGAPAFSTEGVCVSVVAALVVAVILSWVFGNSTTYITRKRFIFLLVLLAIGGVFGQVYMRRRWLRYQKDKALSEIDLFVANSHDFDGLTTAALALIQEVELVSRGYRMYDPPSCDVLAIHLRRKKH